MPGSGSASSRALSAATTRPPRRAGPNARVPEARTTPSVRAHDGARLRPVSRRAARRRCGPLPRAREETSQRRISPVSAASRSLASVRPVAGRAEGVASLAPSDELVGVRTGDPELPAGLFDRPYEPFGLIAFRCSPCSPPGVLLLGTSASTPAFGSEAYTTGAPGLSTPAESHPVFACRSAGR